MVLVNIWLFLTNNDKQNPESTKFKIDLCSKNAELQFFVCCLTFRQFAFLVARIECSLLVISKYVSLLFWNKWFIFTNLDVTILLWNKEDILYFFLFLNFLFWFYNTDPSQIWELFVFEECKATWLVRNNVSCAIFAVITAVFTMVQDVLLRCQRLLNKRLNFEVLYCLHLECLSTRISNLCYLFLTLYTRRMAVFISNETS